jgi:N-acetylneuraminate 9-O-acetyltransferase
MTVSFHNFFIISSHLDAQFDNQTTTKDDEAALLEKGSQSKTPSTKFRNMSTKGNLVR